MYGGNKIDATTPVGIDPAIPTGIITDMTSMHSFPIPEWDTNDLLPPVAGPETVASAHAPYPVSLTDLVSRFGTTPERRELLAGFLAYELPCIRQG